MGSRCVKRAGKQFFDRVCGSMKKWYCEPAEGKTCLRWIVELFYLCKGKHDCKINGSTHSKTAVLDIGLLLLPRTRVKTSSSRSPLSGSKCKFFFDWKTLHLSRKIAWRNSLGAPFKGTADRGRHRWILVSGRRDWTASLDFCVRDGSFGQFRTIRTAPASRRQRQRTEQRPRTTTGTLFIVDQHVNGPEVCVALPSMAI